jgi:FKBP-type peptidyl-prolyl cis-trans isomerase
MRLNFKTVALAAGFAAFTTFAQETGPGAKTPDAPDKEKLSYALGMNLGQRIKNSGVDADAGVIAQALKDVLAGKPTEIQRAEIRSLLKQAETFGHLKQTTKNIADGQAFLDKNSKAEGITLLPDGLQYRVIQAATGELPKRVDLLTLKFRGMWIDGKEFNHNDGLEIPFVACPKGLQEAIQQMKVGSKWQIFVPYNLAYGRLKDRAVGFGSVLIYDLELVAAEREGAHPNQHHGPGGRVGHSLDEDLLPPIFRSSLINEQ